MRKYVLLIDDDLDEAELFRDVLADIDPAISYHYCLNGKTALESLTGGKVRPDIIFLDINMPDMDGWECLGKLKAIHACRDIPVYMYSTSKRENDRTAARKMGAIDLITKANNYGKFKEAIAGILEGRSPYSSLGTELRYSIISVMLSWRNKHQYSLAWQ